MPRLFFVRAKVESVVWSTTSSVFVTNATVVVLQSDCFMQTRSLQLRHTPRCFMHGIIVERVSCLVHGLHDLHGVWCVFQGWDVGTLDNTLSGCITQYLRVGPSELGLCYLPYSPCLLGCAADLSSLQSGVVFHS